MNFIAQNWVWFVSAWVALSVAGVFFNHCCSIVSGNHEDPFRDVGQGGITVQSVALNAFQVK